MPARSMAVVATLVSALAMTASGPLAAQGYEIVPGAIVDDQLETVFFMRASGGVEAVRLATGETAWTSEAADKPLALADSRLVTQQSPQGPAALRLVILDRDTGARLTTVDHALPEKVTASIGASRLGSFEIFAAADSENAWIRWVSTSFITRRQLLEQHERAAPTRIERSLRIGLVDAQVEEIDATQLPDPLAGLPAAAREAFLERSLVWPPVRVDQVVVSTAHTDVGSTMPALHLVRWDADSGETLDRVNLSLDSYVFHRFSAGGRHLLVCQRSLDKSGAYVWHIHDAATGQYQASLRSHLSTPRHATGAGALVFESVGQSRLIEGRSVESPRQLVALSLTSGEVLWSRPLRETALRGPLPP